VCSRNFSVRWCELQAMQGKQLRLMHNWEKAASVADTLLLCFTIIVFVYLFVFISSFYFFSCFYFAPVDFRCDDSRLCKACGSVDVIFSPLFLRRVCVCVCVCVCVYWSCLFVC
jgi:hypothetical protein